MNCAQPSTHSRSRDVTLPISCKSTIAPAPGQLVSHSISKVKVYFSRPVFVGCGRVGVFATVYIVPFAGGQAAIVVVGVGLGWCCVLVQEYLLPLSSWLRLKDTSGEPLDLHLSLHL